MALRQRINYHLLPCKIHYFLFSGGQAGVIPFIPVFAKHLGVSPEVVGILYTILPMVPMFSNPLIGIIADKLGKLKLVMMVALVIFTVFIFSIMFLPLHSPQQQQQQDDFNVFFSNLLFNLTCHPDNVTAPELDSNSISCNVTCTDGFHSVDPECAIWDPNECNNVSVRTNLSSPSDEFTNTQTLFAIRLIVSSTKFDKCSYANLRDVHFIDELQSCSHSIQISCGHNFTNLSLASEESVYNQFPFWWLCISTVIGWISLGTVTCLTDAIILDSLGEQIDRFGLQRLWGTVGAGMIVILTGYLNELASQNAGHVDYRLGFLIFFCLLTADQLVIYHMEDSQQPKPQNISKCIGKLLRSTQIVVFLSAFFVLGVLVGILESFQFWYLEDLGANQLLLGLTRGIQLFGGEMPSFIVAGRIINKIGYVNTVTVVLMVYGIRFMGYSFLINPWVTLPLELTHAAYGIFYSAMAAYASVIAPPGMSATMQAIVGAMYEGAGIGVGSLLGGFLYGSVGGKVMFFWFGIVAVAYSGIHGSLQLIINKFQLGETDIHGKKYLSSPTEDQTDIVAPLELTLQKDAVNCTITYAANSNSMYRVTSV